MKRKSTLLLNIATICLCVCALAFGVISAKNASANISGSIGFTAYNCKVEFKGTITGAVKGTSSAVKSTSPTLYIQESGEPSDSLTSAPAITIGGEGSVSSSLNFGNLAFALDDDYDPYTITFTFSLLNKSAFDVCASLSLENFNVDPSITFEANEYKLKLNKDATTPKEFTITLTTNSLSSFTAASNSSIINLSFEKFNVPTLADSGFSVLDGEEDWSVVGYSGYWLSGVPTGDGTGTLTIPAYFSDDSGELIRVYGVHNEEDWILNGLYDEEADEYTDYERIVIEEGIVEIGGEYGDGEFMGCANITSVVIPNSVIHIGFDSFVSCTSLTTITIPNSVTSIGEAAFGNCTSLANIKMSSNIQTVGGAFYDAAYINNATASSSYVEGNIIYLTDKLNGTGTKLVAYEAINTSITTATIANTTKAIAGSAFSKCTSLTSITIPNSVTSIGDSAFFGCTSLTSITIPNSVTSIGDSAFFGCTGLASITIPEGVTSISVSAFSECTNITSITIPSSVTSIGDRAFSGCTSLTSLVIAEGNPVYDSRDNCNAIIETATNTLISGSDIATIPDSVTSIGCDAFSNGCTSLTSFTFEASNTWQYSSSSSFTSPTDFTITAGTNYATQFVKISYTRYWRVKP